MHGTPGMMYFVTHRSADQELQCTTTGYVYNHATVFGREL